MAELKVENDNRQEVLDDLESRVKKALLAVGLQASTDVAKACPVDTGLLRNSITFALNGQAPRKKTYKAKKGPKVGSYTGTAPNDKVPAVYIGTNVEYAKYIQFGTSKNRHPVDFMYSPIRAKLARYKEIMEQNLK